LLGAGEVANVMGVGGGTLVCSGGVVIGVCVSWPCPWVEPGGWWMQDIFGWLRGYKVGYLGVGVGGFSDVAGLSG